MNTTLHRIKEYLDYNGISIKKFERDLGFSNGSFASQLKNDKTIGVDKVEKILLYYSDINPIWLLTGEGKMLRIEGESDTSEIQQENIIDIINSSDPKLKEYTLFNTINNMSKAMLINAEAMTVNARANEKTSINMEKLINLLTQKEA